MRIKDGFEVKKISGNYTVVAVDENSLTNTIVLTETTYFLWKMLKEKDTTKLELLNGLLNNFDVSTVLALGDIDVFLRTMRDNEIIEE